MAAKSKSILKKLLTGGFTVVIVSFLIAGMFLFGMVLSSIQTNREIAVAQKKAMLDSNADRIVTYSVEVFKNSWWPMERNYKQTIAIISESIGANIIVFDATGRIVTVGGLSEGEYIGKYLKGAYVTNILNGETVDETGEIEIFGADSFLTIGKPIIDGVCYGGVLLSVPSLPVDTSYSGFLRQAVLSLSVAMVIAFGLFYFISKRITDPIKSINNAVTEFSKGKFDTRVQCNTNDELASLSENINNMADSIENMEKMRSSFISNVSHELRTPMTSITGFVEGILDGTVPESRRAEYLTIVLNESKRLSRLVNDLLSISHYDDGNYKVHKRVFNLNELLRQTAIKFENEISKKGITLVFAFEDEQQDVYADSDGITQVVTNLIHNAVKFTPPNGRITISQSRKNGKAVVSVENTGEGISPEKIQYIWDKFYKADDSRGDNPTGIGLGLFIVKRILKSHNETIYVESEYGKFARFTFTLSTR